MRYDDETLMAWVDGALPRVLAAEVAQAVAADPALARQADGLRAAREAVAALPPPPLPQGLEARVRALAALSAAPAAPGPADHGNRGADTTVVPFSARPKPRPNPALWQVPLAAAAALIAGIYLGPLLLTGPASDHGLTAGTVAALDELPSGGNRDGIGMIASFHDGSGRLCREYEDSDAGHKRIAVACRDGGDWQLRLTLMAPQAGDFTPAGVLDVLDAWMEAHEAGAPLSDPEEAAALASR